jgi:hypothetical protein
MPPHLDARTVHGGIAIDHSGLTRYAIAKATGIHQSQLSRFMVGERGLSIEGIEKICDLIGARLVVEDRTKQPTRRKLNKGKEK